MSISYMSSPGEATDVHVGRIPRRVQRGVVRDAMAEFIKIAHSDGLAVVLLLSTETFGWKEIVKNVVLSAYKTSLVCDTRVTLTFEVRMSSLTGKTEKCEAHRRITDITNAVTNSIFLEGGL